ncbi:MAG: hypothetical protein M3Z31_16685 [Pseudomonadota bacterium]|nr:hypothetical protein [Pseudomonadota bacterium]
MNHERESNQRKFLLGRILPAGLRRSGTRRETAPDERAPSAFGDALGDIISTVPVSDAHAVAEPAAAAERLARTAAHRAALLSGTLALPPGPIGMLTVIPDLYLIWKLQRQLVADIFALHGRTAELSRSHMVYCLFRHLASQVVRDVAVRAAERAILGSVTTTAVQSTATSLGMHITRRLAGATAGRWIPLAGAAAVGAYAYWDTMQVAKAAHRVLTGAEPAAALVDLKPDALGG